MHKPIIYIFGYDDRMIDVSHVALLTNAKLYSSTPTNFTTTNDGMHGLLENNYIDAHI